MRSFQYVLGRTEQIEDAQRVRWQVYVNEEKLLSASTGMDGREIDDVDYLDTTLHLLVYDNREPVGTVRLLQRNAAVARTTGGALGLPLESKFDLGAFARPGIVPAEVTRYCVLRRYRHTGVTTELLSGLYAESVRRGITHWLAGANMTTDLPEDGMIAHHVAREMKLLSEQFQAELLDHQPPRTQRRRPFYTEEQRARGLRGDFGGLRLPRPLSLFAHRMAGRFIGTPVYDEYFNIHALPLVAVLEDVAALQIVSAAAG